MVTAQRLFPRLSFGSGHKPSRALGDRTLLPLLGVCGWVLARAGQELPGFIELWAAALNGWRRLRVKAKRKKER